jgi:hypothetical protein
MSPAAYLALLAIVYFAGVTLGYLVGRNSCREKEE